MIGMVALQLLAQLLQLVLEYGPFVALGAFLEYKFGAAGKAAITALQAKVKDEVKKL